MEGIAKKIRISFIHLGFWLLYSFLLFIVLSFMTRSNTQGDRDIINSIFIWFLILPAVISYLLYYWFVFKQYVKHKLISKSLIYGLTVSVLVALAFTLLLEFQIDSKMTIQRIKGVTFELFLFEVFLCTVVGSIAFILRVFHEWFKDQKVKDALKEQNHKMELQVVKAQLDPHFLFNSLNNIDVLIEQDPSRASKYLNKLSDLLRYTLNPAKTETISLKEEIAYIKNYVDLQKIRTSNKSLVKLTASDFATDKQIHSMLFIPFLENAFKYHEYSNHDARIQINIESKSDEILFECSNSISKETQGLNSFKIGNDLIKKRLDLLYPNRHNLKISNNAGVYQVKLQLS